MPDETPTGGGKEVHPASFVGDSIEEFKKLPTWGKIGIGLVFVVVIYLAIKSRQTSQASVSGTSSAGTPNPATGNPPLGQGGAGIQLVPGGNTGQVPILPGGLCPQYDPNGNLIDFAPCGQGGTSGGSGGTTGGSTGGGTSGDSTGGNGGLQGGNPPTQGPVWLWQQLRNAGFSNPLIPSGQYKGPSFSNLKPGTKYTYNGTTYTLTTSVKGAPGSGLLYGINPQGQTVALYGPPSAYGPVSSPAITQPGGKNGATQFPSTRVS